MITEAYARTEGMPIALRQAKALCHLLGNQTIGIPEGDLLAGLPHRLVKVHRGLSDHLAWVPQITFPEWNGLRLEGVPPEVAERLKPAARYWAERKPAWMEFSKRWSEEARKAQQHGVLVASGFALGHVIPDFGMVLELGMEGITDMAVRELALLPLSDPAYQEKKAFLEAVVEACQGAVRFAHRHASLARRLASETEDPIRKAELLQLAEVCNRVPAKPARNFYEALQCTWFLHDIQEQEMGGPGPTANSLGRIDQYLWPYLRQDLLQGRLTLAEAFELLGCFWAKLHRNYDDQHTMVGGVNQQGEDATNILSYLLLLLTHRMRIPRAIGVRVHSGSPRDLLQLAAEVAALGLGVPSFFNDSVFIPALVERGLPLEDARDYAVVGCVEIMLPGRSPARTMGHAINTAKCLELALNNGRCMLTNEQIGPLTGDSSRFSSFGELFEAFRQQLTYFTELALQVNLEAERYQPSRIRFPFLSALTRDCIERGLDITCGGARFEFTGVNLANVADAADGLVAVKSHVFERNILKMGDLLEALRGNFEGQEPLRQLLLNTAPKFGCDEPEADEVAAEIVRHYVSVVRKHRTLRGGPFMPLLFETSPLMVYGFGPKTAALPNGRNAKEPLAMSACPSTLRRSKGPTAEILSVTRLPHQLLSGGVSYILELPMGLKGGKIVEMIDALVRTYCRLGGGSIAFNTVNEKTLREAQKYPERYRWLTVRVFGYSHRFVELSPELQEYVIARTLKG